MGFMDLAQGVTLTELGSSSRARASLQWGGTIAALWVTLISIFIPLFLFYLLILCSFYISALRLPGFMEIKILFVLYFLWTSIQSTPRNLGSWLKFFWDILSCFSGVISFCYLWFSYYLLYILNMNWKIEDKHVIVYTLRIQVSCSNAAYWHILVTFFFPFIFYFLLQILVTDEQNRTEITYAN